MPLLKPTPCACVLPNVLLRGDDFQSTRTVERVEDMFLLFDVPWMLSVLVGNKCDLENERALKYEDGKFLGACGTTLRLIVHEDFVFIFSPLPVE